MPGIFLGARDRPVNKAGKSLPSRRVHLNWDKRQEAHIEIIIKQDERIESDRGCDFIQGESANDSEEVTSELRP